MTLATTFPRWIAHRGAGHLAPENTLAALRHGLALGLRGFECDVKLSADGVPFLLHDNTLERTTNGHGLAHTQPWVALSQLDAGSWHSPAFAGEPPATLAAVLHLAQARGVWLNLELKPGPGDAWRTGATVAACVARHLARHPILPVPLLSSFEPQALAGARHAAAQLPRALLTPALQDQDVAQALALGCTALVAHHTSLTPTGCQRVRQAGLRLLAYTVNQPQQAQALLAQGVEAIITDAIDTLPA